MKFISTKNQSKSDGISISDAMLSGLATDNGLYVPSIFPRFNLTDFDGLESIVEIANKFLSPFFNNDCLQNHLRDICENAFNFPIELKEIDIHTSILNLYHGPTGAFKDVGARFLAQCFAYLGKQRTILVATSGDTGSAVASAFYKLNNIKVVILYPKGKISEFQERQLTCWDKNILSLRVRSDFDTCQKMVKQVFNTPTIKEQYKLTSANSINIGRLLPQCIYYVAVSLWHFRKTGIKPSFIVPTGNLGNAVACIYAKYMGFPIDQIVLACNSNDTIPIYFREGKFLPKASIQTLANAMDVGNPSNMERFLHLFTSARNHNMFSDLHAFSVSDDEIQLTIKRWSNKTSPHILCPHTATAAYIRNNLTTLGLQQTLEDNQKHWIIVSTAHPAKFGSIVGTLIDQELKLPESLMKMLDKPSNFIEINPDIVELENQIRLFLR